MSKNQMSNQKAEFEKIARELECDEDEDHFNATLKQIAPKPKDDNAKPEE